MTNPKLRMTRLVARIDTGVLAAFDAYAEGRGGRSTLLRQLVQQAVKESEDKPHCEPSIGVVSNRIQISFTDTELAIIAHRASQRYGLVPVLCRSPILLCHLGFERERAASGAVSKA